MAEKYDQGPQRPSVVQAEACPSVVQAPASYKQRLGIGRAMVVTTFPNGLTEDEARGFSTGSLVIGRATASKLWPTSTG